MAIYAVNKDIYMRQGDTGNITFSNLPKDKSYNVFISIYNPDTNKIVKEMGATSFTQSTGLALFTIGEDVSNSLPVGEWVYGLKICADGSEDTILPRAYVQDEQLMFEEFPKFTVDYKVVEGD